MANFQCTETGCPQTFAKHHHLRAHISTAHSPSGTKPYRCEHLDCPKSFATNQKLRAHQKTHDEKRYSCSHKSCLSSPTLPFFSTWTKLQAHMRTAHPPTCPYPECRGKIFAQQKGFKAHLKIHEGQDIDGRLGDGKDATNDGEPATKKKRGGDHGRDWACDFEGCTKDFKSVFPSSHFVFTCSQSWPKQKKALTTHYNVSHLQKRDFICPQEGCGKSYGYKHLLQRHLAQAHRPVESSDCSSDPEDDAKGFRVDIDGITGRSYLERNSKMRRALQCPYPDLPPSFVTGRGSESSVLDSVVACEYVFGRAYDLRRHLLSEHGLAVEKGTVDAWAEGRRESMSGVAGPAVV